MFCLYCSKEIKPLTHYCPYCNANQYGENDEFYPTEESFRVARNLLSASNCKKREKKRKQSAFSDEEILALGLYPNDEGYKMNLISRILGK